MVLHSAAWRRGQDRCNPFTASRHRGVRRRHPQLRDREDGHLEDERASCRGNQARRAPLGLGRGGDERAPRPAAQGHRQQRGEQYRQPRVHDVHAARDRRRQRHVRRGLCQLPSRSARRLQCLRRSGRAPQDHPERRAHIYGAGAAQAGHRCCRIGVAVRCRSEREHFGVARAVRERHLSLSVGRHGCQFGLRQAALCTKGGAAVAVGVRAGAVFRVGHDSQRHRPADHALL
mmetsp:Transcript_23176/g.68091  ORF Transcript_23176/g.68091 Transcript_23176/m.68091 type:complete len:232 (+) Transcript_23176:1016-1711(+)